MVITLSKTVASAGTAEAITTASDPNAAAGFRVSWATIQSKLTNTGTISIRAPLATSPDGYTMLSPGDSIVLWSLAAMDSGIDLTKVFIKVSVNGEGVNVTAVK